MLKADNLPSARIWKEFLLSICLMKPDFKTQPCPTLTKVGKPFHLEARRSFCPSLLSAQLTFPTVHYRQPEDKSHYPPSSLPPFIYLSEIISPTNHLGRQAAFRELILSKMHCTQGEYIIQMKRRSKEKISTF